MVGEYAPQEIFRNIIRCSEIASEAILRQKRSHSSYMARRGLHPIIYYKPADIEFHERLSEQQVR